MSLRYVRMVSLQCDVCGTGESFGRINDMTARVIASRAGWRYALYLAPDAEPGKGARQFAVDACPKCPLPGQLNQLTIGDSFAPAV